MSQVYLGQITLMAITYPPRGWHTCDGTLLSIAQYSALFALLGTNFGGDGVQTFALPDLRGRVPVAAGSGPGLSTYTLGQKAGAENVTLNSSNIAPHVHATSLQVTAASRNKVPLADGNYLFAENSVPASPTPTLATLVSGNTQPNSGGSPFSIVQPYLAVNFYIALQGLFPSRN